MIWGVTMIENRNYDLRLVNLIEQLVISIPDDEMAKYLYAKKYEIKKPKEYEQVLNAEAYKKSDDEPNYDRLFEILKKYFGHQPDECLMQVKDILVKTLDDSNRINNIIFSNEIKEFYRKVFNGTSVSKMEYISTFHKVERDKLIKEIIDIIYSSASNISNYVSFNEQKIILYESEKKNGNNTKIDPSIIPLTLFEKIMNNLLSSTISSAMSNYYMFLSGDEVSFSDKEGKKYSFSLDNIHILGLKNNIGDLISYFEKNDLDINLDVVDCPKEIDLFDGQVDNLLRLLSSGNIDECIRSLNNVQGIITDYMTVDNIEQKIELLVYYYSLKNSDVLFINNGLRERFLNLEISKIDAILNQNAYYFGQRFIKDFKTDKKNEYFYKFCLMYNNEVKRDKIVKKYTKIFEVQRYLDYKHKDISKQLIGLLKSDSLTKDEVKSYFIDSVNTKSFVYGIDGIWGDPLNEPYIIKYVDDFNYEIFDGSIKVCRVKLNSESKEIEKILDVNNEYKIESSSKRRLKIKKFNDYNDILIVNFGMDEMTITKKNKRMNVFSLADIFIRVNCKQISDGLNVDLATITSLINIFKIYDKCLYLNNFNFSVDISNIFVTDMQNNSEMGIICEMSAINDALYTLFDYMDKDGTTHFISIQDAESLMLLSSMVSLLPNVINFDGKEYKSIFGFCEKVGGKYKNILTQTHSEFRKKKMELSNFKNRLKERSVVFRYATSGSIDRAYDSIDFITDISDMNLLDLIKKNLYGCSNALLWLENIGQDDFFEFLNITNISNSSEIFYEVKILLYKNVMNNIVDIIDRINIELLYPEMLTKLEEFRISGDSNLLDDLKLYLSNVVKSFRVTKLNSKSTKEEKADYIKELFEKELRMFLLPSQMGECKIIKNQLLDFIGIYSLNVIDSILNMNSSDRTTFNFIRNMNDDELRQFIENVRLRYPSYLIEFMYYKFIDYSDVELEIRSNVSKVKDAVYDRKFFVDKLYSKDKINSMVNLKDSQKSELLYFEGKINSYKDYIKLISNNRIVTVHSMVNLHAELVGFIEQYIILLTKKSKEIEDKITDKDKATRVVFKKKIEISLEQKDKIDNLKEYLEEELKLYSNRLNTYKLINKLLITDANKIEISEIDELFFLVREFISLPSNIISDLKNKISELINSKELNSNVLCSLESLVLRIDNEKVVMELLDRIKNSLLLKKKKLLKYNEHTTIEVPLTYSELSKNSFNEILDSLQNSIDFSILDSLRILYQNINIWFKNFPKYRDYYLNEINIRVKELYNVDSIFEYKNYFELVLQSNERAIELDVSNSLSDSCNVINKTLANIRSSEEIFELLDTKFNELFKKSTDSYNLHYLKTTDYLGDSNVQYSEEEQKLIGDRLKNAIVNVNIVDAFSDCLIKSLDEKLARIKSYFHGSVVYGELGAGLLSRVYDLSPGGRNTIESMSTDLVCIYLVAFYTFLLKNSDSLNLISSEDIIDKYKTNFTDRCISLLDNKLISSDELLCIINNNSGEGLISEDNGKRY